MNAITVDTAGEWIQTEFSTQGVDVVNVESRRYPGEVNYLVFVRESDLGTAAVIGNELDSRLGELLGLSAFVVVRKSTASEASTNKPAPMRLGVHDQRATDLIRLISARSRVSVSQPSLSYVRDAQANLSAVTAGRHHLVFGRRGAGKTALLVEARRLVDAEGAITCWSNIQTLRHEHASRVALYVMDEILSTLSSAQKLVRVESIASTDLALVYSEVRALLDANREDDKTVTALIPRVQKVVRRFLDIEGRPLYVFLDDFYYVSRDQQPWILDLLHGCVRDSEAWLKVASIRHLTRWWQSSPPMGLQTIHDADLIDLDVTLQDPARAKAFLESVLMQYASKTSISTLTGVFSGDALDRLVLASGAVPRDYLVLAASSISKAQGRANAKQVGVQDVNQAAGDAAGAKAQELEDDMASNVGTAEATLRTLNKVRHFCLEEMSYTYFLVSYRDKERNPAAYSLLTDLMDVRLIHLIDAGVSDAHSAGSRSEAFLLDLSQYSGSRLKQRIHVLDFSGGKIVARQTRTKEPARVGDTARKVVSILRGAPTLELSSLVE